MAARTSLALIVVRHPLDSPLELQGLAIQWPTQMIELADVDRPARSICLAIKWSTSHSKDCPSMMRSPCTPLHRRLVLHFSTSHCLLWPHASNPPIGFATRFECISLTDLHPSPTGLLCRVATKCSALDPFLLHDRAPRVFITRPLGVGSGCTKEEGAQAFGVVNAIHRVLLPLELTCSFLQTTNKPIEIILFFKLNFWMHHTPIQSTSHLFLGAPPSYPCVHKCTPLNYVAD